MGGGLGREVWEGGWGVGKFSEKVNHLCFISALNIPALNIPASTHPGRILVDFILNYANILKGVDYVDYFGPCIIGLLAYRIGPNRLGNWPYAI